MFPVAVFVFVVMMLRMGSFLPGMLENRAEASILGHNFLGASFFDARPNGALRVQLEKNPSEFYTLSVDDLGTLFGAPGLSRQDGEARMVQYVSNHCAADFYYLSGDNNKITHYEIRQLEGNTAPDCLREILQTL
ncbi:MAG: hypothetical protein H6863_04710 [Rhodospirillales bacterium]|nr:hypothetical protein [Rhodospirillales bacterium]MCB9980418.1 hypothetical protein [Rhodospirillales bacterium]